MFYWVILWVFVEAFWVSGDVFLGYCFLFGLSFGLRFLPFFSFVGCLSIFSRILEDFPHCLPQENSHENSPNSPQEKKYTCQVTKIIEKKSREKNRKTLILP